jgi:ABC-2 type transport system ATP-binding protein
MSHTAIEVESLEKTFRDGLFRRRSIHALRGVSFTVESGSIFGLLGPNGAGKTTLIKVLLGLVRPTGGNASLLGRPAGDRRGRRNVGYLPESHRIPRHLTGNSALSYYGGLSGLRPCEIHHRRAEMLKRVGLTGWGDVSVKKYSKGMLQRLGLAQAMLHDPELLILDEPTDGVDPVGRSEIRAVLYELKAAGKTIFINSHLLQEIELVCDRVAILVQGSLRRVGMVEEIKNRPQPDVEINVVGSEPLLRDALSFGEIAAMRHDSDNRHWITLRKPDQATLNRCIDALRSRSLDILAVTPLRDSLEDAFLDIVNNHSDSPDVTTSPGVTNSPGVTTP